MSTKEDYEKKIEAIKAIDENQIKATINMPVDAYIQEAENLYHWCQEDKDELISKGLSWDIVTDLPIRSGALREAESLWNLQRFNREEAEKLWIEKSPLAYDLRNELLHDLRFAFRKDKDLSARVTGIAEGEGHADMIQDLNDLSILGKENPELLAKINFDMSLLDKAAELADEMAPLLGEATSDRAGYSESKMIRDKAFTYLKEAVDEVYDYGQYLFWRNENRKRGYRSNYLRRRRIKRVSSSNESE